MNEVLSWTSLPNLHVGGLLALWAGERAADSLVGVAAAIEPRIAEHSDRAHDAVWAMGVLAVLRLSAMLWDREPVREIDSHGVETMILKKMSDGWRIVHIHWSSRAVKR